ncbi:glycosyltransferase [Fluviispira multicolorata]|uniref:Glycosyltransferase n=1 Tax=Fluviispira multicolorata TaxID=2654512 RepID=A0A833JD85_9BACT|nr:glycosyltransferase [Fluviispira multicolorata]KAB8031002.1 glycosyltransferase [Fluviispira multicolorata]
MNFIKIPYTVWQNDKKLFLKPKISLIMTCYNNFEFFNLTYYSLLNQSLNSNLFEVVVCDDGSNYENSSKIKELLQKSPFASTYIWHEDRGFRKSEILNKGIYHSKGDYLVFIDADCMLHSKFLEDHLRHSQPKSVLVGRRAELTKSLSRSLTPEKILKKFLEKSSWWLIIYLSFFKDGNGFKTLYLNNEFLFNYFNRKKRGIVGCNFSCHKKDIEAINGFNMRFQSYGGEESDLEYRLRLVGVQMKSFCHRAIQYHIFHAKREQGSKAILNEALLKEVEQSKIHFTEYGLNYINDN